MDIRGIEVTNQLRSAIRAKLLELGVRYDEELPDYILVMVVNKKSRQQMHDDLHLFLEDCTTPFVDWLHDQVLKKLQKVTIAKKKTLREFVPAVVVKQEEERKKKKISTTSFLEDQDVDETKDKVSHKILKTTTSKPVQKDTLKPATSQKSDVTQKCTDKSTKNKDSLVASDQETVAKKTNTENHSSSTTKEDISQNVSNVEIRQSVKPNEPTKCLKRPLQVDNQIVILDKRSNEAKKSKVENEEEEKDEGTKKLKSCVNKPRITSVVSVKNRLGIISPRKKFEVYREKLEIESRHRQLEKRRFDNRNNNFQRGRIFEDERSRRNREAEAKKVELEKFSDVRSRLGGVKIDRTTKSVDPREKIPQAPKAKLEKETGTIKDRLGTININKVVKTKSMEQERDGLVNNNVKNRLGPLKGNFKPLAPKVTRGSFSSEEEDSLNVDAAGEVDDATQAVGNSGPIKSHIIAVRTPYSKTERKRSAVLEKSGKQVSSDPEEELDDAKIPSKVIVTPRPLKPLLPIQKRATQSLLLRAVAEANQSVVTQKNPEPSLLAKKTALKRVKPTAPIEGSQNLSVHLNATKRLVMEKIQVELNTTDSPKTEPKSRVPQPVSDEHMGVVMSLFQRSDNNQKFLVTLNGYNNNFSKEKVQSDDDEQLEMEVNEDDEISLLATQNNTYESIEREEGMFRITDNEEELEDTGKERSEENNENCNTENMEKAEDAPRKRRKLSPIVYNRTRSPSPQLKSTGVATSSPVKNKKASAENNGNAVDKSREKCRYWPNCTLGHKCAYMHPPVMCSLFPACKFGDKCAYRHPKCKFGLSCTKLGCIFSHPAQQCKYHPFCTKPACPFLHPTNQPPATSTESNSQRAKFTWRRRD